MNLLQRCWQRRWLRGLVWTVVTLVTLGALLIAWTNWSGAREWQAAQAMIKAAGETLDFRATMHDPIPEAENYCAIPLLKDLALIVDHDADKGEPAEKRKRLETLKMPSPSHDASRPKPGNLALGRRSDLKEWAEWLRQAGPQPAPVSSGHAARDVLGALATHDPIFQELTDGLNRPKAQWTPEWKTRELPPLLPSIALPHYAGWMGTMQTLMLRGTAAGRAGDTEKAHETTQIMARLNEASLNDPFLIGLLVGVSGTSMLCNVTWELCGDHAGKAQDFDRLEATLQSLDLPSAMLHACRGEMAAGVSTIQYLKGSPETARQLLSMFDNGGRQVRGPHPLLLHALSSGFVDASSAVFAEQELRYLIKPLRDEGLLAANESALAWDRTLVEMKQSSWRHPTYLLTALTAPVTTGVGSRVIYVEALRRQAIIACALERYRLDHEGYPDSLDGVKLANGQPLPMDIMNGQSMHYHKTAHGRYALWSVGFDGKDDGGKRELQANHPENTKFSDPKYLGDWVWDYPND